MSVVEEFVLLDLCLERRGGESSAFGVLLKDDLCQVGVLLLKHLELALDLRPALLHLGGNHREVASILLQQLHQPHHFPRPPHRPLPSTLLRLPACARVGVGEGDFLDSGGDGSDWLGGGVMRVVVVNSHAEDITGIGEA